VHADPAPDLAAHVAPEVSGVLLRVLADVALKRDVPLAVLFQSDAERFMASDPLALHIPLAEYRALLHRALVLTGEPALGLHCGASASEAAFDLLAPLIAHVPTLRHGIREATQFLSLIFEGVSLQLYEGGGVARLQCELPRGDHQTDRVLAELVVAGAQRMLFAFGAARNDVFAASFEHTRPSYSRAYAEVFQGAECFAQARTGIEFAPRLLDRPNLYFNAALQTLVHAQAEAHLAQRGRPTSLVSRLQMYLAHQPTEALPEMDVAARALGVSVRSLRRRLAEEQLSYRALTQDLQRERACTLLRNPALTLQAVADAVGFSDLVAFHRAFKRWTGVTASAYRSAL
jgi:AraC-like DNA-binding protein